MALDTGALNLLQSRPETKKPPEGGFVRFAGSAPVANGERHVPFGLFA